MTQKERLVELLIGQPLTDLITPHEYQCAFISKKDAEDLADHLLSNGVIVPPCKVGDMMYAVDDGVVYKERINFFDLSVFTDNGVYSSEEIFASYEEAEQALKEREANGNV